MSNNLIVVVLAAGQGKRLGTEEQKVVRRLLGKPILSYLLTTIKQLLPEKIVIVVGHKKESVRAQLEGEPVTYAEQPCPMGTGDAVMKAQSAIGDYPGDILILCGDVPFLTRATLQDLINLHRARHNAGTILTALVDHPTGYGRIRKNESGNVVGIVEEVNASPEERKINEINAGVYVFQGRHLFAALAQLEPDPVKGEYYLTDVIKIFSRDGRPMSAHRTLHPEETIGINTVEDLHQAEELLRRRGSS